MLSTLLKTGIRLYRHRAKGLRRYRARSELIGFHSSRIAHDMRGVLSAPKIYAGLLQERLADSTDPVVIEAVNGLNRDLEHAMKVLNELSGLSRWVGELGRSSHDQASISIKEAIEEAQRLLQGSLKGVEVSVTGEGEACGERSYLISAILNPLLASLESFKRRRAQKPRVSIDVRGTRILFKDNGGGFSQESLATLAATVTATVTATFTATFTEGSLASALAANRPEGATLGLLLLADWTVSNGGKIRFSNVGSEAEIEIQWKSLETESAAALGPGLRALEESS